MNVNFKKLVIAFCVLLYSPICAFSQATMKHIVDRGETLATIAQKYNTTEAKLLELNPDAAQFVYVGMELVVPTVSDSKIEDLNSENKKSLKVQEVQTALNSEQNLRNEERSDKYSKWSFAMYLSYGFLPKNKGVSSTNYTYAVTVGADYNITKNFYIGARIGYNSVNLFNLVLLDVADYYNTEVHNHMIYIPLELGYRFFIIKNNFWLTPYIGLDFNYVVKSTMEQGLGSNTEKISISPKNRMGLNGRVGVRLNIRGFNLGCAYVFSMDKNFGDNSGFPEVSIGTAF